MFAKASKRKKVASESTCSSGANAAVISQTGFSFTFNMTYSDFLETYLQSEKVLASPVVPLGQKSVFRRTVLASIDAYISCSNTISKRSEVLATAAPLFESNVLLISCPICRNAIQRLKLAAWDSFALDEPDWLCGNCHQNTIKVKYESALFVCTAVYLFILILHLLLSVPFVSNSATKSLNYYLKDAKISMLIVMLMSWCLLSDC